MAKKLPIIIAALFFIGLAFRLYHLEFGLPHSFYADEPEISEPAIKYTYELKSIIASRDFYKLIPVSFVYGTFPVYVYTVATMAFSKINNLLNIPFDKTTIFIFLRVLNALFFSLLIPAAGFLYYKIFKRKLGTVFTVLLVALNWKFIVLSHYVNQDSILALLLFFSFISMYFYLNSKKDTRYTALTGVFLGLAFGTKVTALITFPFYALVYLKKKDIKGLVGLIGVIIIAFIISNPFSLILSGDFFFRVYSLMTKEGGLVFDSVDLSAFKYIDALSYMLTPLVFISSIGGAILVWKKNRKDTFNIFLLGQVLVYIIFYSVQSRRVDRWMLPIMPILLMYSAYALQTFSVTKLHRVMVGIVLTSYLLLPILLLTQFQRWTPKSEAYLWLQGKIQPTKLEPTYAITEEGLDPINKLPGSKAVKFSVYASENAQLVYPPKAAYLTKYKYIVISSRPMDNFKKPEVQKAYPDYTKQWIEFEQSIESGTSYKLIKDFVLTKPNLIPLSDVFIYENLNFNPSYPAN